MFVVEMERVTQMRSWISGVNLSGNLILILFGEEWNRVLNMGSKENLEEWSVFRNDLFGENSEN